MSLTHLPGIRRRMLETPRGRFCVLESGSSAAATPVLLVHGNLSAATFWEETMLALPPTLRAIAPDLRGYGDSPPLPVDATRGLGDFSDDLHAIAQALALPRAHLAGHSMGGCIAMRYTIDHPEQVRSLTLIASGSPFGFGGTKDVAGTPCWPDYAGSGGGLVHPELIARIQAGDRSSDSDFSPRVLLRQRLVVPPFQSPREDVLVEAMLRTATGTDNYSRDMRPSANWPGIAPGTRGANNALSPRFCNLTALADIDSDPRPPLLWVRGDGDQVVSDRALSDPGTLGQMGVLPGWPGAEVYPPQPMLAQLRALLVRYQQRGGQADERVLAGCGHMPHIEQPAQFYQTWLPFLNA